MIHKVPSLVLPKLMDAQQSSNYSDHCQQGQQKAKFCGKILTPVLFLPHLFEFCSAPDQSKSTLTSWMALGRVNFIIGTNIKSKQFTRCATCVRICGEINKLLLLDHWSLNALLIWKENQRCFGNGVCVHACSQQRK